MTAMRGIGERPRRRRKPGQPTAGGGGRALAASGGASDDPHRCAPPSWSEHALRRLSDSVSRW